MGIGRLTLLCITLAAVAGCSSEAPAPLLENLAPADWADAAGRFRSPTGEEIGHVVLTDGPNGVLLRVDLKELTPGWHAIHLHQTGDCSDGLAGFKASGSHIDPDDRSHGLLNSDGAERADLPNLYAGADGRATAEFFQSGVALYPSEESAAENGPYPLLDDDGFALIIHESHDNHMDQPIGNAGGRVACAALGGPADGEQTSLKD